MKTLITVAIMCLALSAPALAADSFWTMVLETPQVTTYIAKSTIKSHRTPEPNSYTFFDVYTVVELKRPIVNPLLGWTTQSMVSIMQVECKRRAVHLNEIGFMNGTMGTGTMVYREGPEKLNKNWQTTLNPTEVNLINMVCK